MCERISEEARLAAIDVTNKLDAYLAQLASGTGERFEREADTVSIVTGERVLNGRRAEEGMKSFTLATALSHTNQANQQGLYAFETLVSNHIDKAFDKFTAWALRNPFDVPDDIEVVLVSCFVIAGNLANI